MNDQTIQYIVGMTALTALGMSAMVLGGSIGQVIAVAVAGCFGFHIGTHGKTSSQASPAQATDNVPINGGA